MKELLKVMLTDEGTFDITIDSPVTEKDMDTLSAALANTVVQTAKLAFEQSEFICHMGCVFAAIIELSHKKFFDLDRIEYLRIVEKGLLTKATATGTPH